MRVNSPRVWLVEIGPLVWGITSLWAKLVCFGASLRSLSWAPEEPLGRWLLAHPDMFTATLASLVLLFAPLLLFPRVSRFMILLLLNLALSVLVLVNAVHFRFYGNIMPIGQVSNVYNLRWVVPSIIRQLHPADIAYCFDIVVGILILPYYLAFCRSVALLDRSYRKRLCCGLLVLGIVFAAPTVRLVWQDKNLVSAYTNLQREVAATVGLPAYYFGDAMIHAASRSRGIGECEHQRVLRFVGGKRERSDASSSNLFGSARGRNVIVIMAESLQTFPIGLEIRGQLITPRLSAFAKESLYFVNFYDQTHLATTSDGEFISFQSLHPLPTGAVAESRYSGNHYYGLPATLSHDGYSTLSACGESGAMWYMNQMHPRLGFQRSFFEEDYKILDRIGPWLADREFFAQTIPILKAQTEPFLAYLLTSSNHDPFEMPEKHRTLNLGELEGSLLGNYLHSVHYFDRAFGEFVDQLRESGLLEKSLLVLYGDHQAFMKGPELARLFGFAESSEYDSFCVRKRVPLFIRLPYAQGAGVRNVTGGHLDIAPTLLSLLGIVDDSSVMFGRDLTQGKDSLVVFRDGSFADGRHYFINHFGGISASACYEAETGRTLDCGQLEERRRGALEQLEISDLIIRGDLIPILRAAKNRANAQ